MTRDNLFDAQIRRDFVGPRPPEKSYAWYLARSVRPEFEAARQRLERWYAAFPPHVRPGLRSRLVSDDNDNHNGAVLELFLHATFAAMGFGVEPEPSNTGHGKPDFRLEWDGRPVCFLEATTLHSVSESEADIDAVARLFKVMQPHVRTRGFSLAVRDCTVTLNTPQARRVASFIDHWLATLNHADVLARHRTTGERFSRQYQDAQPGWRMTLEAIPLADANKVPESLFGAAIGKYESVDPKTKLLEALERKRDQHKGAELRLVVAVSCNDYTVAMDHLEITGVARGTTCCEVGLDGTEKTRRLSDGFWSDPDSAASRRVAGFIWTDSCLSWIVPKTRLLLIDNPHREEADLLRPWPLDRIRWIAPSHPNCLDKDFEYCRGKGAEEVFPEP